MWLAALAGLGLLALAGLAALAQRGRDRWRSVLDDTRAARGELGEALPVLLLLLVAVGRAAARAHRDLAEGAAPGRDKVPAWPEDG